MCWMSFARLNEIPHEIRRDVLYTCASTRIVGLGPHKEQRTMWTGGSVISVNQTQLDVVLRRVR